MFRDERSEWSFVTATLYGFGIVTTLGYNRIAPITYAGRLFCIVYGICGIPLTMIIIANVGQYLNNFAGDSRRKVGGPILIDFTYSAGSIPYPEEDVEGLPVGQGVQGVVHPGHFPGPPRRLPALCRFGCIAVTSVEWAGRLSSGQRVEIFQIDFFNGLYYNFLCLTAIDFGQLVPSR